MSKTVDIGVFIPVGNHGWIHSTNSPDVEDGSFSRVLEITRTAEALGFDFVLSPGIWRGRKGPSRHWMDSLESLTTTAALLNATSTIDVFATIHMTVYQPAIIAKMMGTLDQIGGGRVGLNLVTGSSYLDLSHVGLWRDGLSHDERYDLADEWIAVVKKLWTEEVASHEGDFFKLEEATMGPKPSRLPPLANAGASPRGFRFAVENCDIAFIGSGEDEKYVQLGRKAKETAQELGKPNLKVYGLFTVIPGETDEAAQARLAHFDAGVDLECLEDIVRGYDMNPNAKDVSAASKRLGGEGRGSAVSSGAMTGSYDGLAHRIAQVVTEGELDGIILIVPDYIEDLKGLATHTLPKLAEHGVLCNVAKA